MYFRLNPDGSLTEGSLEELIPISPSRTRGGRWWRDYGVLEGWIPDGARLVEATYDPGTDSVVCRWEIDQDQVLDLNSSSETDIAFGIHGIGIQKAKQIVSRRPYQSLDELIERVTLTPSQRKILIDMVDSGSLVLAY